MPVKRKVRAKSQTILGLLLACVVGMPTLALPLVAQSGNGQNSAQPATNPPAQNIPDAPSAVQPPPPVPAFPKNQQPETKPAPNQDSSAQPQANQQQSDQGKTAPPLMPPVETVPAGTFPRNQIDSGSSNELYKIPVSVNLVLVPVMVKDSSGRRVDGLLPRDFAVFENNKPQKLTFFSSDPIALSVAIVIDIGMPDVTVQKINQTYSALAGALSPYDEAALYTFSSTVSQVADFTGNSDKLTAALNGLKLVRGGNGPPVLTGPMAAGPPTVNGAPVGGPTIQPVNTPEREDHVLNDAILRAALDLSKRERTRRKVILVISNGRELGSKASYRDVLRVLETRDIQVKAVVVDTGSLPLFRQVDKIHLPDKEGSDVPFVRGQGYSDILPKYSYATGGGDVLHELSRNAIEDAYAQITSETRNQYTLGYAPKPTAGSSAYRSIEVRVDYKHLKISAKDGYYPR